MSSPSPEPSAESLAEARALLAKLPYAYPPCGGCAEVGEEEEFERESRALDTTNARTLALAIASAKRSSRREALGQAADLAKALAAKHHAPGPMHTLNIVQKSAEAAALDLESSLRSLMEAE